jgi:hypothetical protein
MKVERKGKEKRQEILDQGRADAEREKAQEETQYEQWETGAKKQYVRDIGWLEKIAAYCQKRTQEGVPGQIKYLTLPGRSAMDIGLLRRAGYLPPNSEGRLNAVICDEGQASDIANRLKKFGGVIEFSDRRLIDELRVGTNPIPKQFPFDVVNLDFCNSLVVSRQENLQTLEWIFEYQGGAGFLLLLTARAYPDPVRYANLIEENFRDEPEFANVYQQKFGRLDASLCFADLRCFSQIIFPKLVARIGRKYGYRILEQFVCHYLREGREEYNMVCHTLEMEPVNLEGPAKYAQRFAHISRNRIDEILRQRIPKATMHQSEIAYSQFIPTVLDDGRSVNVDRDILSDAARRQALEDEAADLVNWMGMDN